MTADTIQGLQNGPKVVSLSGLSIQFPTVVILEDLEKSKPQNIINKNIPIIPPETDKKLNREDIFEY